MPRPFIPPEINKPEPGHPLIIGRDPGSDGGQSGQLLFGGYDTYSGRPVEGIITSSGLSRSDFNITNRCLRRPWNNDFYRHSWNDINDGLRQLRQLIEDLQPSVIITLGNEAVYDLVPGWPTLTDRKPGEMSGGKSIKSAKGINDRRGFFWYPDETGLPCPLIASLHPASCLYQPMPNRVLLDIDIQRLGEHLRGELVRQPWPDFTRITSSADLAPLWDADLVAYDIEIKWGGAGFLCVAFYTSNGQALLAYEDALGACAEWFRSDRPKLAHNGQFDRYYLEYKINIPVRGRHEDTIVGHWATFPEMAGKADTGREGQKKKSKNEMTRKGLNFLASWRLDVGWWKSYTSDPHLMGRLCVNDVAATMWCWEHISEEIENFKVRPQYERQLAKLPALIAIQGRGLMIDTDLLKQRVNALISRQDSLQKAATEAALDFLQTHNITHRPDGSEYWWYHDARCECCFGGEKQSLACDTCANLKGTGANGGVLKKDLIKWAWRNTDIPKPELDSMSKEDLTSLLPSCRVCKGTGRIPTWDFNPMSPVQLPDLLWTHLGVPKYCAPGGPDATEETIKKVQEWSKS